MARPMIKPLLLFFGTGELTATRRGITATASMATGAGAGALIVKEFEQFGQFTVFPMAVSGALTFAEQNGQTMVKVMRQFPLRGEAEGGEENGSEARGGGKAVQRRSNSDCVFRTANSSGKV